MDIKDELRRIISKLKNDEQLYLSIDEQTDIINEIGLDSLQMISLLLEIEETFDIIIDYELIDINKLQNLSTIETMINETSMK